MLICGIMLSLGGVLFFLVHVSFKSTKAKKDKKLIAQKEAKYVAAPTSEFADYSEKSIQVNEGSLESLHREPGEDKGKVLSEQGGKDILEAVVKAINEALDTNYNVLDPTTLETMAESNV